MKRRFVVKASMSAKRRDDTVFLTYPEKMR